MDRIIKSYLGFVNEGREQEKIDQLLDIMKTRKLTQDEKDLLTRLSMGETLPDDEPVIKKHKTGGFLFDEEGNVMTEEEPVNPGEEFYTTKGKQRSAEKLETKDVMDARIYKNKESLERFIFAYVSVESESGMTNEWIVYRTGKDPKFPYGQFLDPLSVKYQSEFKNITPDILWERLDYMYDYGMVLDRDLYEDFTNFVDLYKTNQAKYGNMLLRLRDRFMKLL